MTTFEYLNISPSERSEAGAYLRNCRIASSITQTAVDSRCGFVKGFTGRLERGEVGRLRVSEIIALQEVLQVFKYKHFVLFGWIEESSNSYSANSGGSMLATTTESSKQINKSEEIELTFSDICTALFRIGLTLGCLFIAWNYFFNGETQEVKSPVPEYSSEVVLPPGPNDSVPEIQYNVEPQDCGFHDSNCDGIDDRKIGQLKWNPGWDYDGDGIPNSGDTDVNGDGIPNGRDRTSDAYEVGGLSSWGCAVGQPSC